VPPPLAAGPSSLEAGGLEGGELQIGAGAFDPLQPALRAQLLSKLGCVGCHAVIEEMQGFRGGLNEGVWFISKASPHLSMSQELVLKLVRGRRIDQHLLTEAENFIKIFREHPSVASDPILAFPAKLLSCVGPGGVKRFDLITMRKIRGDRLAELIARKWYGGQVAQLMHILEKLGACLAGFHGRYGNSQHGDFQPSNVLYDEERDALAFIDVGGMGVPTTEGDVEHFSRSIRLLADSYGARLATDGLRHFEQGYAAGRAGARGLAPGGRRR
jgi:hypothetical protein